MSPSGWLTALSARPKTLKGSVVAPGVGLEPTTYGLTVRRSAD
jgi:hypothetical protein